MKPRRDRIDTFAPPRPSPVLIRAPAPLDMRALCSGMDPADETACAALLDKLRRTLQSALDALSLERAPLQKGPLLPNPFWR